MCQRLRKLSKSNSGELLVCEQRLIYHLEFNNMYFEFNENQFDHFKMYVLGIDCQYWECKYACSSFKRKIPIPSMQDNLLLMFSRQEIEELKSLLRFENREAAALLNVDDIDYRFILN